MSRRPRIGITMRLEIETRRFYLGRDYCEAIEAAGGVPVHLGLIPKEEYIAEAISHLDGILLPGSDTDVDPLRYGEEPHPRLKKVIPEKDETDLLTLAAAEELGLPILAICYGMQALNVFRGGSLYQNIEAQVENSIKHEQGMPLDRPSHGISVDRESVLAEAITGDDLRAQVNSHHHQAVRDVGRGLKAVAWAKDGVIEGIQDTSGERFILGVQWHPELSWERDPFSKAIFRQLIEAARG